MKENIKESILTLVEVLYVILAGLAGLWWSLRMGGGILMLTGLDLKAPLFFIMIAGLIWQGYSNLKSDRRYPAVYRILLWISGLLVSLLIYGLLFLFCLDLVTLVVRLILGCQGPLGSGIFMDLRKEAASGTLPEIGLIRHGTLWNLGNAAVLSLLLSGLITLYGVIHAQALRVHHYAVSLPDAAPCRIVHLSDLHMGSIVNARYIRRVIEQTAALHPDYVVITGDLFNHGYVEECRKADEIASLFAQLDQSLVQDHKGNDAASGTIAENGQKKDTREGNAQQTMHTTRLFAVLGNHDPEPDDPALNEFLSAAHITLLYRETVTLPEFRLAGYGGLHVLHRPAISSWLTPDPTAPHTSVILLDHYPDSIQDAQKAGAALLLSGHTHGGQYFPNNLLIRHHYAHGLMRGYSVRGTIQSIVSQGTGFFQVPIRIGTDSEILCIDLH